MRQAVIVLALVAVVLAGIVFSVLSPVQQEHPAADLSVAATDRQAPGADTRDEPLPDRSVLDISVHTLDELRVLLDRAEQLAPRLLEANRGGSVVLVLHGPEVEFFSSKNYDKYRAIVDQAARLDAFDIVDVKICQTMMNIKGISRDDIPAFIEQIPDGRLEVERLLGSGYVYF